MKLKKQKTKSRTKQIDWEHDPLWDILRIGKTKETDIVENHDYHLYGWGKKENGEETQKTQTIN